MQERCDIFTELFQPGGNELYVRPARWLLLKQECCSFITLAQRASESGEVLLGYMLLSGELVLNPNGKDKPTISRTDVESLLTIGWSA